MVLFDPWCVFITFGQWEKAHTHLYKSSWSANDGVKLGGVEGEKRNDETTRINVATAALCWVALQAVYTLCCILHAVYITNSLHTTHANANQCSLSKIPQFLSVQHPNAMWWLLKWRVLWDQLWQTLLRQGPKISMTYLGMSNPAMTNHLSR